MALKDKWVDKIDGVDVNSANDINQVAHAVIELEKNGGGGGIAVEADPTVPDWAKQPNKPTYTASEVGAVSQTELEGAVDTALAQAKASGEFDGADGKSAYQYAKDGGYTGTEAEFASKLAKDIPEIVQETGDSKTAVMSQKAVTDSLKFKWDAYGLPKLLLYGDTSAMTKDNAVTLDYVYGDRSGTCTVKWQGSSSIAYPKKNYTIKFDNAFEAKEGWGEEKKYCLKADWIDFSHCRNVVSAKLWGDVVRSRATSDLVTRLSTLPNCGADDGIPCFVVINDEWMGVYNFNIPKDGYMFGMVESADGQEAILCANLPGGTGCRWWDTSATVGNDYDLEFVSNKDNVAWVQTSLANMIKTCLDKGGNLDTVAEYLDIDSAVDYFIYCALTFNTDGIGKNHLLSTFDGEKWFFSAYDLDATWGLCTDGKSFHGTTSVEGGSFEYMATRHTAFRLVYYNAREKLIRRYKELRNGALSVMEVMARFNNYASQFPAPAKIADAERWLTIQSTDVNNTAQIAAWYAERTRMLDAEIAELETREVVNAVSTAQAFNTDGVYNSVGYKNNYIFSKDANGYEYAMNGYVLTGIIPYDSRNAHYHPIYIKGNIDLDNANDTYIRMAMFKNGKTFTNIQSNGLTTISLTWNVTKLGDGYYRFYPLIDNSTGQPKPHVWCGQYEGIVITLKGNGEGLVISVDNPIDEW